MNMNQAKTVCELTMVSGLVPLMVGVAGVGKSDIVKTIAKDLGAEYVNIDANLLGEGEIGGLPIASEDKKSLIYVPHNKLARANELAKRGKKVVLFIDELNRAQQSVQSELMNLVLNREINGLQLHKNIMLIGAMNPSSNSAMMDDGANQDANYATNDLDDAVKNRFVWVEVEADISAWLSWANGTTVKTTKENEDKKEFKYFNIEDYETNIDPTIINFLAENPEYLKRNDIDSDANPSPRTYSFASAILRTFEANSDLFTEEDLKHALIGTIGLRTYTEYKKNQPIRPEDLLNGQERALARFENSIDVVQKACVDACVKYLERNKNNIKEEQVEIFFNCLDRLTNDCVVAICRELKTQYKDLFKKLSAHESKDENGKKYRRMVVMITRISDATKKINK